MIITTTQDYALVAACCPCALPVCEAPRKDCQSVSQSVASTGFRKPESTEWERYKSKSTTRTQTDSYTHTLTHPGYGEYIDDELTSEASITTTGTYNRVFESGTNGDCPSWPSTLTETCDASGSSTQTEYVVLSWGSGGEVNYEYVPKYIYVQSVSDISGTETQEHQDWEIEAAEWDENNPDHEAAIAAWEADVAAWNEESDQYTIDYQAWVDGGFVGDPPTLRDYPERPADRPEEPEENYPPCTYKVTLTATTKNWVFNSDGTTDHGEDDVVVTEQIPDPTQDILSFFPGVEVTEDTYTEPTTYSEWVAEVKTTLEDGLNFTDEDCLEDECQPSFEVTPEPELEEGETEGFNDLLHLSLTKARYRMGIPASSQWDAVTDAWTAWDEGGQVGEEPEKTSFDVAHAAWVIAKAEWDAEDPDERGPEPAEPTKRTFFQIQWDEVQFPAAWDAWKELQDIFESATKAHEEWEADTTIPKPPEPEVPEDPGEAPTPGPTVIASRSWTYEGESDFSSWYELAAMEVEGETRVVNIMTKCYRSARIGSLPTAHGEIYEVE